jgi:hypothetical protein
MAAAADLIAYRPANTYINYALHPVAATLEDSPTSGPGIRVNGDDDNKNLVPDYLDKKAALGDNDLVRVDVAGSGTSFTLSWNTQAPLAVWTTATKSAPLSNPALVRAGQSVWVEYIGQTDASPRTASLTLTVSDLLSSATDSVLFHRFQSVVIAIGGFTHDPRYFGDPSLGTFTMAGKLYDTGYDVHLFAQDQVQSTGKGAAYNEVKSAVLTRNVDYVAIFGFSWGGGATYELAAGLRNTPALAGKYQLKFTAYVDGIQRFTLNSETRLPLGTQFHANYFQRIDWLLKGNSVAGAKNVNVTQTFWGKNLNHTTIDDNAILHSFLLNDLITRVTV